MGRSFAKEVRKSNIRIKYNNPKPSLASSVLALWKLLIGKPQEIKTSFSSSTPGHECMYLSNFSPAKKEKMKFCNCCGRHSTFSVEGLQKICNIFYFSTYSPSLFPLCCNCSNGGLVLCLWALTHTHTHTVRSHGNKRLKLADSPKYIAGCLYCPSYLFSSHRQHAAALLHSDWLVLGPRAERSRTQAAEQVESQDRRGQRSLQGQTGVRPGHNRPPLELTQPANRLAPSTPQSSDGWNWASNLPLNAKGAFICPSEAPGSVWGGWPLFWFSFFFSHKPKVEERKIKKKILTPF